MHVQYAGSRNTDAVKAKLGQTDDAMLRHASMLPCVVHDSSTSRGQFDLLL